MFQTAGIEFSVLDLPNLSLFDSVCFGSFDKAQDGFRASVFGFAPFGPINNLAVIWFPVIQNPKSKI
jgi:hypothetical protein